MTVFKLTLKRVSPEQWFMLSALVVNGGNYLYNLLLGRFLGPEAFADAALLVTLLLVLSFVGMTFQLTVTKFAVEFSDGPWVSFKSLMYRYSIVFGIICGALLIIFSKQLQTVFNTQSQWMFVIFGIAIPLYFIMSVNRGKYQGGQKFVQLATTYQTEMWGRLLITFAMLLFLPFQPIVLIAIGIALSFLLGLWPFDFNQIKLKNVEKLSNTRLKQVLVFIGLTAGYELTQIIINNSDILLVKHYFSDKDAGLYASLALMGRVVYFIAWMFVMLLMPTVLQKRANGEPTVPILFKYVAFIGGISATIVLACLILPETIVTIMFGKAYISVAYLLWQYALATSLFAISNIFAYYFLSLNDYKPVIFSGVFGLSQIALIVIFHNSLKMVIQVQIIAMVALLLVQLLFFAQRYIKQKI